MPILSGVGCGALLANVINLCTMGSSAGDTVGIVVGICATIAGVVGAHRNGYRSSTKALAEAIDDVYVALTSEESSATRDRAWRALARAVHGGGAPSGGRRNRLVDRPIGAVLAVVIWKLGSVAPHLSKQSRSAVLQHMARRRVDVHSSHFAGHALEFIADLRYRLAQS
jgi:hypothetical protein